MQLPVLTSVSPAAELSILELTSPPALVGWALQRFAPLRIAFTTAFGLEGCALIDMLARTGRPMRVLYLDTGFFFSQTHALRERLMRRYPHLTFVNVGTTLTPQEQERLHGPRLWERDPDACCRLRKIEPMRRVLSEHDVWMTSIRRDQTPARAQARVVEWDWRFDVLKFNPLAHWGRSEVVEYVRLHSVPYNPLHDRGYPSIGCTHCTHPVEGAAIETDSRAGRWSGTTKSECGLHANGVTRSVREAAPALRSPPVDPPSSVEAVKLVSGHLRGTIGSTLESDAAHFSDDDYQILKFHGIYQQDDRDERNSRRKGGLDKAWMFMVRVAIPGGALRADQWLALDALADRLGNASLRLTSRQGVQFHGVAKGNLERLIADVNSVLLTTLAACGDVRRNVMATPAPVADEPHRMVQRVADEIARALQPATGAYHEIWIDGEQALSTEQEATDPFYGDTFLPRKFKIGVAIAGDASIDIYTQDCGLLGVVRGGRIAGFNLLVGGGLGMTHKKSDTFARLASVLGFIQPEHAVEAVRVVGSMFRDFGNRSDRRHARLKYLVESWGLPRFRDEFQRRFGGPLDPPVELEPGATNDCLGRHEQGDGRFFYGIFVENGRVTDRADVRVRSALREIAKRTGAPIRLTPAQSLLFHD
ncbi:MAG: NADPH-dependent assimilatory sulfite reductase hemoprotein subunit, partial [Phycisphaerales bacterium]|nr:NADPH-dependent assimilatory sulfite reductase hemoprotein subunit [Phycisphaerales bacterium]